MRNGKQSDEQKVLKIIKHHNIQPRVVLTALGGFVVDIFTILCYNILKSE